MGQIQELRKIESKAVKWRNIQIRKMRNADYTLQLIGDTFGISRERVRQVLLKI